MTAPQYSVGPGDPFDSLAEECAEIIKERMKCLRFGEAGTPEWIADGNPSPRDLLVQEVGDLLACIERIISDGTRINMNELRLARNKAHDKFKTRFGIERPRLFFMIGSKER